LVGLAIILAVISFYSYVRAVSHVPVGDRWYAVLSNRWSRVGQLFFCAGMVLTSGSLLERGLWGLLCLAVMWTWWRIRHQEESPLVRLGSLSEEVSEEVSDASTARSRIKVVAEWLVKTELLWLVLLSPFFLFPSPERAWSLAALPILWIARRIARGRFVSRTPLDWAIALLMLMVLVSLFATFDLSFSLGKIAGVLLGIGLYYALVEWASTPERLRWAVACYAAAGVALAVVGLLGADWISKFSGLSQITSRLPALVRGLPGAEGGIHPNEVGGALTWVVPLQLSLVAWSWLTRPAASRGRGLFRVGLLLGALLSAGTLLLTQSRSALTGTALALAMLLWLAIPKVRLVLAALLVIGIAAAIYVGPQSLTDSLADQYGPGFNTAKNLRTAEGRAELWGRALHGIEDFPFTGMGMNTFRRVMPVLYPLPAVPPTMDVAHAHNHLLQAALDLGLPGLVAYLAIWMLAGAMVVAVWRVAPRGWSRFVAAGVGAGLLAHFVYGMTDTVALGAKPGIFFWGLLAILAALARQHRSTAPIRIDSQRIELSASEEMTAKEALPA